MSTVRQRKLVDDSPEKGPGPVGVGPPTPRFAPAPPKKPGRPKEASVGYQARYLRGLAIRDPQKYKRRNRENYLRYRVKALQMVSGSETPTCAECGCDDPRVLQLDHQDGGGGRDAAATPGGLHGVYIEIVKNRRLVSDFRVLCGPDNWLAHLEKLYPDLVGQFKIVWNGNEV
jgi:hypothetical protein